MLAFILDLVGFLVKSAIIIGLISIPIVLLVSTLKSAKKNKADASNGTLVVQDLKKTAAKRKKVMRKHLKSANPDEILKAKEIKEGLAKEDKQEQKKEKDKKAKAEKFSKLQDERAAFVKNWQERNDNGEFCPDNLFVLDFKDGAKGTEVKNLRRSIDAILEVAKEHDEVVINLTSPGGLVNSYGLCASQIKRLRDNNIYVTVTVDQVAASGGYLMACVANKIVAAPFAYVGSIGVIAGIPNFRKILNKYDVDYEQITAGKFKRTLSVFGENTPEGREKFKEELEAIHNRFKEQVAHYRPQLDMDKVATGEHWLASDAKELNLVDELATSDEYINRRIAETKNCALKLSWKKAEKQNLLKKYLPKALFKIDASPRGITKAIEEQEHNQFLNIK